MEYCINEYCLYALCVLSIYVAGDRQSVAQQDSQAAAMDTTSFMSMPKPVSVSVSTKVHIKRENGGGIFLKSESESESDVNNDDSICYDLFQSDFLLKRKEVTTGTGTGTCI